MSISVTSTIPPRVSGSLPDGARLFKPETHPDRRGTFTEIFRLEWDLGAPPVQWNLVSSRAGVLRGLHAHLRHTDYFSVAKGRIAVGLFDARPGSPTEGRSILFDMDSDDRELLLIPTGVAHAFYCHTDAVGLYAVSEYWNHEDELGCHWADPEINLSWPATDVILSDRDAALPSLRELKRQIAARLPSHEAVR